MSLPRDLSDVSHVRRLLGRSRVLQFRRWLGAGKAPGEPSKRSDGRRRSAAFWVGLVLVVGGLGILGYVGWQLHGTTIVRSRSSRASWRTWSRGSLAPSPRMGKDVVEADVPVGRRLCGPVDRGVGDADLARGYGHFPEVLTQVSGATTRWRNTASRMENPCAAC